MGSHYYPQYSGAYGYGGPAYGKIDLNDMRSYLKFCIESLAFPSLIGGIMPWVMQHSNIFDFNNSKSKAVTSIVSLILCSGAGILLGSALLIMTPMLRVTIEDLRGYGLLKNISNTFPLAEVYILIGFVLYFCLEETAVYLFSGPDRNVNYNELESKEEGLSQDEGNETLISYKRPFIGLFGLVSIYVVCETLNLGLQKSKHMLTDITCIMLLERSLLSFCVGMELVQRKIHVINIILCVLYYSIFIPIVICAIFGSKFKEELPQIHAFAIFQGVLIGGVIYNAFMVTLHKEKIKAFAVRGISCYNIGLLIGVATVLIPIYVYAISVTCVNWKNG